MTIKIEYFSDVLCIWAYSGQIRMDELKSTFADEVDISYRFIPIFGAGKQHVQNVWKQEGGVEGFNRHLHKVAENWPHITLSEDIWTKVAPQSSTSAHVYLKAVQLLAEQGEVDNQPLHDFNNRTCFEEVIWLFRHCFFHDGKDIALRQVQDSIAEEMGLPLSRIAELIDSGLAYAALHLDDEARKKYRVPGSPTLVLNEGRQLLYGNVGYRIIDANIRELIHNPDQGEARWC